MAFLTRAVYRARRDALNAMMDAEGLEGVVVMGEDFFQFYTNFHVDVRAWERPIALMVPRRGEPVAIMNALSTGHFGFARDRGSLWVDQVHLYQEFPLGQGDRRNARGFPDLMIEQLDALGMTRGRIGVDARADHLEAARVAFPEITVVPSSAAFRQLRWVKEPEELKIMADLGDLMAWVRDVYRSGLEPGRLVHEFDHWVAARAYEEAGRRFPGEHFNFFFYTLSGPSSASPHGDGGQAGARMEAGHGIVSIFVPHLNGVTIEDERTYFLGQPTDVQRRAYETALDANLAGIEAVVAGRPVSGIDAASRGVIERAGYAENILHRTGHGMGLAGHEFPEDMAFNHRALIKDEVYSVEPGIYLPGVGGFRLDDTVVVGADGPIVLTPSPKDIDHHIIA